MKSAIAAAYVADKSRRFRVEEARAAVKQLSQSDEWLDRHGSAIIEAGKTIRLYEIARVRKAG